MSFDKKIFASDAKTGELVEFPDVTRGWGATIDETNRVPPMSWFNGAFNRIDENMGLIAAQGILEWQDDLEYKKGAIAKKDGVLYIALKDNTSTKVTDTECWFTLVGDTAGEIDSAVKNAISTHEQSRNHPDASLTEKGFVKLDNTVTSTSVTEAATANAAKTAYDRGSLGVTNAATAQTAANNAQSTANNALPKAGGTVTGEIISTSANNYRMIDKNRGFFFRLDANFLYIMRTKENDPNGSYDTFRPIRISAVDDIVYIAGTSFAGGVMNGTATNSQKLGGKELSYFATRDAVVTAQSTANAALPKAGGTMTGQITMGKNKIDMSDGWSVNSIHAGAQASDSPAEIGETETNLNFRVFRGAGFIDNYMDSGNYGKITIGFDVRNGKINATTFNGTATNSQKLGGKESSYFAPSADAVLKSTLLQTTGTATNNTMSQNAITQNIDKRALQSTLDNLNIGRNYCTFITLNSYEDWGALQIGGSWVVRGASYGVGDDGAYYYCTCVGKREQSRHDPGLFILTRLSDEAVIIPYFLSGATSSSGTRYMKKYLIGVTLT